MGAKRRAGRRYYRTTLLGVVALGALIWVAVQQFQIAPRDVAELALGALLMVVLVIFAAALVALLWVWLRKLLRRGRK